MRSVYGVLGVLALGGCHDWSRVRGDGVDVEADDRFALGDGGEPTDVESGATDAADGAAAEASTDVLSLDAGDAAQADTLAAPDMVALDTRAVDAPTPDATGDVEASASCGLLAEACCLGSSACAPWSNCTAGACASCGGDREPVCNTGPPCRPGYSEPGHSGMCH